MKNGLVFGSGLVAGLIVGIFVHALLFAPEMTPVFSPEDGRLVLDLIGSAQKSVDIEIYTFSSRDVVEALEEARSRGVEVRIIIEKNVVGGENQQIFDELSAKGFDIRWASRAYKLTHAKFMVVDGVAVLVGSHNLSNSALFRNREASLIVRDRGIAADFHGAFEKDWTLAS
ncbi:MAG: phospholipase D family protein [Candidatus Micrarchaeia archaeon]